MPVWTSRAEKYPLSEDQVKGLLKRYDRNGDGKLSRKELEEAFRDMGLHFCGFKARRALHHADANHDGYVGENELNNFYNYAKKWGFTITN